MNRDSRKPIQCTLKHHLGTLRESDKGWRREVNIVSWEGAASRLDIRDWSKNKDRSSKGVTFTRKEVERLRDMLTLLNTSVIEDSGVPTRLQDVQVAYNPEENKQESVTDDAKQETSEVPEETLQEQESNQKEFPFALEEVEEPEEQRAAV
ncbi:MAG: hypothetical protein J6L76_06125 [Clostridia bacterium]|nr:hypothetical protein [Clostridia bacterium]